MGNALKNYLDDETLNAILKQWKLIDPCCLLILQDEAPDAYQPEARISGGKNATVMGPNGKPVQIFIPEETRKKEQTAIGTGVIIAIPHVFEEDPNYNPRISLLNLGDRIKFCAGTQINAEFKGYPRVQMLHINNVLMVNEIDETINE